MKYYLLRSMAGGSCLSRKMILFGVLMSISAQEDNGEEQLFIRHFSSENFFLPYFLFDCGPYFLAAKEALSMM